MPVVIIAVLLSIIMMEIHLIRRAKQGRTPRDVRKRLLKKLRRAGSREKQFDFFVSYQSENAPLARQIAELLIAQGYWVWFDEYVILLVDREKFREEMDMGIGNTRYGVCLTDELYVNSKYCMDELRGFLQPGNCGPGNVVDIRLSEGYPIPADFPEFGQLLDENSIKFRNIAETLAFLEKATGRRMPVHKVESPGTGTGRLQIPGDRESYTLDLAGWERGHSYSPRIISRSRKDNFFAFKGVKMPLWGCVSAAGGEAPDFIHFEENESKEVRVNRIIESVYRKHRITRDECFGVHFLKVLGHGQFAFSLFKDNPGPPGWYRIYTIFLPGEGDSPGLELNFEFLFRGHYRAFCRYACWMDQLVLSLAPAG